MLTRALGLAALAALVLPAAAWGHAGLLLADPPAGANLGASPTVVRLTFSERPQASFSSIRVVGARGVRFDLGRPKLAGDSVTLAESIRLLPRGLYTVRWRVVSSVDGHASSGTYVFGVRTEPTGTVVTTGASGGASRLELPARWIVLGGLLLLVGAAAASVGGFGGARGDDLRLAAGGWLAAVGGLLLLGEAQRRTAGTSLGHLLGTPVGHALGRRAAALALAGIALLVARRLRGGGRRVAMLAAGLCAVVAIVAHVLAGHAESGSWPHGLNVAAQAVHVSAAGIWLGGLAALLVGTRGAPSAAKAAAVRRFSAVALAALLVVAATGTVRAADELTAWGQLATTGYGRGIVAKAALLLCIVVLGARHRRRSVPLAAETLAPLRRTGRVELGLAAAAVAVAALLGTMSPPATGKLLPTLGLSAAGSDAGATVSAALSTASADPGPNRFVVRVTGYRSTTPVPPSRVRLIFTPLDDPGVRSTSLLLGRSRDGSYAGSGPNLAFDGRWGVRVVVDRAGGAVEVPLEVEARTPAQDVAVALGGTPQATYTVQVGTGGSLGYVRFEPRPGRSGPSRLVVTAYTVFENEEPVRSMVVDIRHADGPWSRVPLRRVGPGSFAGPVVLAKGTSTLSAVTYTTDGVRVHAVSAIQVK